MYIPKVIPVTPWEHQPIAWRVESNGFRRQMMDEQLKGDFDHLVREVRVQDNDITANKKLTIPAVETIIEKAATEFNSLAACGINVPNVEWHVFEDDYGKVRTLAKVAIIDGIKLMKNSIGTSPELFGSARLSIAKYYQIERAGNRLAEIAPVQCMNGIARPAEYPDEELTYLVDIEPVF